MIAEQGSEEAIALWDHADRIVTSRLAYPEARAALATAARAGRLSPAGHADAKWVLRARWSQLGVVEAGAIVCEAAGDLAERHGLRGYDAVHLASALVLRDSAVVMTTWDRDVGAAARRSGLGVAGPR